MSFADSDSCTSSLPIWTPFISYSYLIAVDSISSAMLIEVARMGILILFLSLEEKLSAFHCWEGYRLWVCHNALYYVEKCFIYTHSNESCNHEWRLNSVKCFFCIYWDDHEIFLSFLHWLIWKCWIIPFDPRINLTWSWYMIF